MRVHVCAVRMTLHRADVLEAYLNGQDNIQKATVYCTETSEAVAGEKNSVSLIKCHHRFRPMHHRGHVKAQFMAT